MASFLLGTVLGIIVGEGVLAAIVGSLAYGYGWWNWGVFVVFEVLQPMLLGAVALLVLGTIIMLYYGNRLRQLGIRKRGIRPQTAKKDR